MSNYLPRTGYVPLNRTFLDFVEGADVEDAAALSYRWFRGGTELTWDGLLNERLVVVLGEAGSGKTWEFVERERELIRDGKQAFFVRIEDLAEDGLEAAILPEACARLRTWMVGTEDAVFLLDSVDEARLKERRAFFRAIRKLADTLDGRWSRVRIVISCRVSEWQPETDRNELSYWMPSLADKGSDLDPQATTVRVVQLAPLDDDQVRILARTCGLQDSEAFFSAIESAHAWEFARRPKDVQTLVTYWQTHERLGSLTELIEHDLEVKLREANPSHADVRPVPPEVVRRGTEQLAAATVLCRKASFLVPDETVDPVRLVSSLAAQDLLPSWAERDVKALLSRAVFDEETYGRVRFHHRSITEYLAAEWFRRILEAGGREAVEDLVFKDRFGGTVVPPSLAPVLGWLACFDDGLRRRAIEAAPEVLLRFGDPQRIPVDDRAAVLRALDRRYREHRWLGFQVDASILRRFADPALVETLNALLTDPDVSSGMKRMALDIVLSGELKGCEDAALALAVDVNCDLMVRLDAVQVLKHAETFQREALAEYARTATGLPSRLWSHLCWNLYPSVLGVKGLHEMIRHAPSQNPDHDDMASRALSLCVKRTVPQRLPPLLAMLLDLATEPPLMTLGTEPLVSSRYQWLVGPIAELAAKLIETLPVQSLPVAGLVRAQRLLRHAQHLPELNEEWDAYRRALQAKTDVRRLLYWAWVEEERQSRHSGHLGVNFFIETVDATEEDLDWLLGDVVEREHPEDRLVAFEGAVSTWLRLGKTDERLVALRRAAEGGANFNAILDRVLMPPSPEWEAEEMERQRHWEAQKRQKEASQRQLRGWLQRQVPAIRAGQDLEALSRLVFESKCEWSGSWAGDGYLRLLKEKFGEEVSEAAREGWKAFWRTWIPLLTRDREESNRIEAELVVGLAGLATEFGDGLDPATLSPEDVECAIRYATRALKELPEWLNAIARVHVDLVRTGLLQAIESELATPSEEENPFGVLWKLAYGRSELLDLVAPKLLALLEGAEVRHPEVLRNALAVIGKASSLDAVRLNILVEMRAEASVKDEERFLQWFIVWLGLDDVNAFDYLEKHMAALPAIDADALIVRLASMLGGSHWTHTLPERAPFRSVCTLRRLIPLLYTHIRPEDDIAHSGVYSPGLRDDAQDYRQSIVGQLGEMRGDEAYKALLDVAAHPALHAHRDWLQRLARDCAAGSSESPSWTPIEVVRFQETMCLDPKTADDLFAIAVRELSACRMNVERGNFSPRALFTPDTLEEEVQKLVADYLRTHARNRYTVSREDEVIFKKRTDVRLWSPKAGTVTIEIKRANEWSYKDLEDALANQLVGQYLRDADSQHGVLLLALLEPRSKGWFPATGGTLNFEQLIDMLDRKAREIATNDLHVRALRVLAIDFTSPN